MFVWVAKVQVTPEFHPANKTMEATNMNIIEINIGYPIIFFYAISLLTLTMLYGSKLKLFYSFIFSMTIISFCSSLWELPTMIVNQNLFNAGSFTTGLAYFIPLPLFLLVYNIKINWNSTSFWLIIISLFVSIVYSLILPPILQAQLGQYYSLGYLTTFIPRTLSLIAIAYLCYPDANQAKFHIQKFVQLKLT